MTRAAIALALLAVPALSLAGPSEWVLDGAHTQTSFQVLHLGIASYRAEFASTSGIVTLDEDRPAGCHVEATIDAASIRTRTPAWDARLRSSEFLDVAQYPTITFRSTAVVRARVEVRGRDDLLDRYRVTGSLRLHGVTRQVVLEVAVTPTVKDPQGRLRRGIWGRTRIDRQDFGIRFAGAVEGGPLLSDDVDVQIEAELVQAPAVESSAASRR